MTIKDFVKNPELMKTEVKDINEILTIIKNGLEEVTMEDVSKLMQESVIKRYVQFMITKKLNNEVVTGPEKENLYDLIFILQTIYNNSGEDTGVSDYDYDRLYELLNDSGEELISSTIVNGKKGFHKYPTLRGTLMKIYVLDDNDKTANESRGTLADYVKRCEKILEDALGYHVDLWEEEIYVFPKWDGVSVEFEFDENNNLERALTRGNTETNEATIVTTTFLPLQDKIKDPAKTGRAYGEKTEVMVHDYDLDGYNAKYGTDFKSTRSIASSIINTEALDGRENLLEVVRLRTSVIDPKTGVEELQKLASNAFERPYIRCRMKDTGMIRDFAYNHRNIGGLNCDGAVIYIINEKYQKILGRKDHKNQFEIAFKFNEEIAHPKITDIDFQLSPYGHLFPVARFTPTKMKGNTVYSASLGSMERFNKLHLAKGDHVKVLYEIIPYLLYDPDDPECKRSGNEPIQPPTHCPECEEELVDYTCINPNCPCRLRGKILMYVKETGMKGIGEATINDLWKAGIIRSIVDLYKLRKKYDEIVQLPGWDSTSAMKLIMSVEKYGLTIPANIFMSAIGIFSVGKKTFNKIFEYYKIDELIEFAEDMKVSELVRIPGIAQLSAMKILTGIKENRKLITKLMDKYVDVVYTNDNDAKFIAVFHKIRSDLIKEAVEKHGGRVDDNLTKKTNFLIVPSGFRDQHSATSDKARKYGCPIIEIDEVEKYLDDNYSMN